MIDAKLKGEGIDAGEPPERPERTNVDLMAAPKKRLGQPAETKKPAPAKKKAAVKVTPINRLRPQPDASGVAPSPSSSLRCSLTRRSSS
jgi:hypothetical protein